MTDSSRAIELRSHSASPDWRWRRACSSGNHRKTEPRTLTGNACTALLAPNLCAANVSLSAAGAERLAIAPRVANLSQSTMHTHSSSPANRKRTTPVASPSNRSVTSIASG